MTIPSLVHPVALIARLYSSPAAREPLPYPLTQENHIEFVSVVQNILKTYRLSKGKRITTTTYHFRVHAPA